MVEVSLAPPPKLRAPFVPWDPPAQEPRVLRFAVAGVSCPSCIKTIETAVGALPGVSGARLNFTTGRLAVTQAADGPDAAAVIAALAEAGHQAAVYDPDSVDRARRDDERRLLRALAVAGFAAANVMLLSVAVWAGLAGDMGPATRGLLHWASALIALPAIAYAGQPFYRSAWGALGRRRLNMDVPISLAVLLAAGVSLWRTYEGGALIYFDAALMLLFFLLIGRVLDRRLRNRARSVVQNLMALRANSAMVIQPNGLLKAMAAGELTPGLRVRVAAGERLAADGRVVLGTSSLDESLITGESLPRPVDRDADVYAGTMNLDAPIEVEVTAAEDGSLLAEIAGLLDAAEQRRGRGVRLADRAAAIYAPAVHGLAALTFAGWMALGGGWEAALMNALAVLIITCPCALGLAVPAVQAVAVGRLLRGGLLVKQGDALERLAQVDRVLLDKTGTLTLGRPALVQPDAHDDGDLAAAAGLAAQSRHPLAKAIQAAARRRGLVPLAVDGVEETPGLGLAGTASAGTLRLGNAAWCGIEGQEGGQAGPVVWLCADGRRPVRFDFVDALRPDAAAAISALEAMGLSVTLLSGDRAPAVQAAAQAVGLTDWRAGQRPAEKIAVIESLRREGHRVLMVGDGLNDAPALAAADASMAPAEASAISQTKADCVFQGRTLAILATTLKIARRARRLMLQNFALAGAYNLIAVPLAMAGLVTPLIAAVAMSASSLLVTLNALRLARGSEAAL